jgi:SMI1 / KNR4 family (SUKH-1)
MSPAIEVSNAPIQETDIAKFAQAHKLELPAPYVQFLLETNGGRPVPDTFPITGMDANPFGTVQAFFGLNDRNPEYDLEAVLVDVESLIPHGILPIAADGGGDSICLDLRTPSAQVVFWDRRFFWGTGIWREEDLYFVADSFAAFLHGFSECPY